MRQLASAWMQPLLDDMDCQQCRKSTSYDVRPRCRLFSMQTHLGGSITRAQLWNSLPLAPKLLACCTAAESLVWIANFVANIATVSRQPSSRGAGHMAARAQGGSLDQPAGPGAPIQLTSDDAL